jgi:uncharacterized protein YeaO (DUF488 family)
MKAAVFHCLERGISGETRETGTWVPSVTESPEYRAAFIASVTWDAHREIESQLDRSTLAPDTATDAMGAVNHQSTSEELENEQ